MKYTRYTDCLLVHILKTRLTRGVFTQVFEMDISKQLHAYEVEYHVLQDELQESTNACEYSEPMEKLERANSQLKRQNMDLLEKLQVKRQRFDQRSA